MGDPNLNRVLKRLEASGLRRGVTALEAPRTPSRGVSSGHPGLDAALGTGGFPRGSLAFLNARVGDGSTSLALSTLAGCQSAGGLGCWLDLDATLDPAVAARLGIATEWVLLGRPRNGLEAVELAAWLGRSGLIDLLVLDLGQRPVVDRRALDRLGAVLARSGSTAALLLAPGARSAAAAVAGVRVALQRSAWLTVGADLVGQRVRVTVERHRGALAGGTAEIDLWFAEGRRLDALAPALAERRAVEVVERPALRVVGE